jgi:hypothetical protein
MAADRVKRLKELIDMVMVQPESPERDRLLSELRSRAVDLDTGVTPRAMLPIREPVAPPVSSRPLRPRAVPAPPRTPTPAPAPLVTAEMDWDKVLNDTPLLSLDDSPDCWPSLQDDRSARPWTLGLRG